MSKRDLTILFLSFAAAIGLSAWIFLGSTMETGSWGLSFRQEGAPPIGTAGADQLHTYDAAYLGNTGEKVLYLTFDAGYENGCTASILDTLKKHEVKAVFFLVGNYLEKNADLVRRMADEGHTVGNHTMHHYDMSAISDPAAFAKELQDLEKLGEELRRGGREGQLKTLAASADGQKLGKMVDRAALTEALRSGDTETLRGILSRLLQRLLRRRRDLPGHIAVNCIAAGPDRQSAQDQGYVVALPGENSAISFVIVHKSTSEAEYSPIFRRINMDAIIL